MYLDTNLQVKIQVFFFNQKLNIFSDVADATVTLQEASTQHVTQIQDNASVKSLLKDSSVTSVWTEHLVWTPVIHLAVAKV